jgi:hypothetical protein
VSGTNQEGNKEKSGSHAFLELCKEFMRKGFEIPLLLSIVFVSSLWIVAANLESNDLKDIIIFFGSEGLVPVLGWILFVALLLINEVRIVGLKRSIKGRIREVEELNEKLLESKLEDRNQSTQE